MAAKNPKHILVFEPRLAGHHLSWLRYITEDFLAAGHRLTLALDGRPDAGALYQEQLGDLLPQVSPLSIFAENGRLRGGSETAALGLCLGHSGAEHAFMNNLDDIASSITRRAAIGLLPPPVLKGRLSGVYFRPRFLAAMRWPLGNRIKLTGFRRLARQGWFHKICLVDEYLHQQHAASFAAAGLTYLPDTWSGHFEIDQQSARCSLGISPRKFVLLHYGIGTRRKGLHLISRIMNAADLPAQWHLLCAGQIAHDRGLKRALRQLQAKGRATLLDRYVSKEEEQACFAAADVVPLPYIRHFGSSGVLALAAAAGKPVVASDDGLIARRVRQRNLGFCFPAGDVAALKAALQQAEAQLARDPGSFRKSALLFARQCDRAAFRSALWSVYDTAADDANVT